MAGATAITGWLILLVYALYVAPVPSEVTRDYVHYLYTSDILIGGEVDKILDLSPRHRHSRHRADPGAQQLIRSVAVSEAAKDLTRFFAPEVADRITHSEDVVAAGEGVLRDAAILFVDLRDSLRSPAVSARARHFPCCRDTSISSCRRRRIMVAPSTSSWVMA